MQKFIFWSSVGIMVLVGSYLIISLFKKKEESQKSLAVKKFKENRREAGFHAIARDHVALQA